MFLSRAIPSTILSSSWFGITKLSSLFDCYSLVRTDTADTAVAHMFPDFKIIHLHQTSWATFRRPTRRCEIKTHQPLIRNPPDGRGGRRQFHAVAYARAWAGSLLRLMFIPVSPGSKKWIFRRSTYT